MEFCVCDAVEGEEELFFEDWFKAVAKDEHLLLHILTLILLLLLLFLLSSPKVTV